MRISLGGLLAATLLIQGAAGQAAPPPSPQSVSEANPDVPVFPFPDKAPAQFLESWLTAWDQRPIEPAEVQQYLPTESLLASLERNWAQGEDPAAIRPVLQQYDWQDTDADLQTADVDGDGQDEWLVTVNLGPEGLPWGRMGDFWIIGDGGLKYRFFQPDDYFPPTGNPVPLDRDFIMSAPKVAAIQDFTGDGVSDVLAVRELCGAHTCTQAYRVIGKQDGELRSLISTQASLDNSGDAVVLYYSDLVGLEDETGDGVADLVLHAGAIASAGAGPQRTRTEVWAWNGSQMRLAEVRLDPTTYRFHLLYEANDALARGELDPARTLYQQVIEDDSLEDLQWNDEIPSSYDSTVQFAAFRLALIGLLDNDRETAAQWQAWLKRNYPETDMAAAANRLIELSGRQALEAACTNVRDYLVARETPDDDFPGNGPTGRLRYMGYGNPSLAAADVCPPLPAL